MWGRVFWLPANETPWEHFGNTLGTMWEHLAMVLF